MKETTLLADSERKACPCCAESIAAAATECRFCGEGPGRKVVTRLRVVGLAGALVVVALSFVGAASSTTTTGWQLVAKASDRNSRTPDATILSESVLPAEWRSVLVEGQWVNRLLKPEHRVVTQSTRPGNRLTWEVTCYVHSGSYTSTSHTRGRAWPGSGKRLYAITTPTIGSSRGINLDGVDANCFATVTLDAPSGRARTLGVWLQERLPD
jgi:hypothetical protein